MTLSRSALDPTVISIHVSCFADFQCAGRSSVNTSHLKLAAPTEPPTTHLIDDGSKERRAGKLHPPQALPVQCRSPKTRPARKNEKSPHSPQKSKPDRGNEQHSAQASSQTRLLKPDISRKKSEAPDVRVATDRIRVVPIARKLSTARIQYPR